MNRKKIILYGVVGVVAIGVLISDMLSGGPTNPPAQPNPEPAAAATPAVSPAAQTPQATITTPQTPATAPPPGASVQRRYVVRHLHDLYRIRQIDIAQTPNVFAMPRAWQAPQENAVTGGPPVKMARPVFHLSALMVSPTGAMAIINNKVIYMNQSIEGYRLEGIGERTAELSNDDEVITLKLKQPLPDGSGTGMNIGPAGP